MFLNISEILTILVCVMARPKKPDNEKVITISATVKPSLGEVVKTLAKQRQWSPSQAAGILIEKGLESEGVQLPKAA